MRYRDLKGTVMLSLRLRTPISLLALLTLTAAALGALVVATTPANADDLDVESAELTWGLLANAFNANNLAQNSDGHAPAERDATEQVFVFPVGDGVYDPDTHDVEVSFDGAAILGNTTQGAYRIVFAEPTVSIDGDGDGTITADLYVCTGGGGSNSCPTGTHPFGSGDNATTVHLLSSDVVIATFSGASRDVDGDTVTWGATPDFPDWDPDNPGRGTWPEEFITALGPVSPSMLGHFRQTGSSLDPGKVPQPFTFEISFEPPPPPPPLAVEPSSDLRAGDVVTVTAHGFNPDRNPHYLAQCRLNTATDLGTSAQEGCADGIFVDIESDGSGVFSWTVLTGAVGDGVCNASNPCEIHLLEIPPIGDAMWEIVTITFAADVDDGTDDDGTDDDGTDDDGTDDDGTDDDGTDGTGTGTGTRTAGGQLPRTGTNPLVLALFTAGLGLLGLGARVVSRRTARDDE